MEYDLKPTSLPSFLTDVKKLDKDVGFRSFNELVVVRQEKFHLDGINGVNKTFNIV